MHEFHQSLKINGNVQVQKTKRCEVELFSDETSERFWLFKFIFEIFCSLENWSSIQIRFRPVLKPVLNPLEAEKTKKPDFYFSRIRRFLLSSIAPRCCCWWCCCCCGCWRWWCECCCWGCSYFYLMWMPMTLLSLMMLMLLSMLAV